MKSSSPKSGWGRPSPPPMLREGGKSFARREMQRLKRKSKCRTNEPKSA